MTSELFGQAQKVCKRSSCVPLWSKIILKRACSEQQPFWIRMLPSLQQHERFVWYLSIWVKIWVKYLSIWVKICLVFVCPVTVKIQVNTQKSKLLKTPWLHSSNRLLFVWSCICRCVCRCRLWAFCFSQSWFRSSIEKYLFCPLCLISFVNYHGMIMTYLFELWVKRQPILFYSCSQVYRSNQFICIFFLLYHPI